MRRHEGQQASEVPANRHPLRREHPAFETLIQGIKSNLLKGTGGDPRQGPWLASRARGLLPRTRAARPAGRAPAEGLQVPHRSSGAVNDTALRVLCLIPRTKLAALQRVGVESLLQALGGPEAVRLEVVDSPAEANTWVRDAGQGFDRIAIGGGDGSLNAVAGALAAGGVPVVILPLGTANDLARTLGIPLDPLAAAQLATQGRVTAIDLGEVNGHPFFNVAGIGLSVTVARRLAGQGKRWGVLSYPLAVADTWRAARTFRLGLECDGETLTERSIQVSIGNGPRHGGGLTVAADATIDDGLLDVSILHPQSWLRLLAMVPWLRRGTHPYWKTVTAQRGRTVTVVTRPPRSVNVDGEIVTRTPARLGVRPGALRVVVPA